MPKKNYVPATKKLEHKLACMQHVYDIVSDHPGCNTVFICDMLFKPKTTVLKWIRWVCEDGFIQRNPGPRKQHGSHPDTFIAIGPRPHQLPEKNSDRKAGAETQLKRILVKARNCGMRADPLALPREFFGLNEKAAA